MTELSGYVFSALRGGEFTLYRGSGDGLDPILLVAPIGEYSARESLKRLEHEHDLKAELDADWAVRPVALSRHDGRMALVLEDPGGEPLDQLLGQPMDVTQFLRIAIPLAAAIGQVHRHGLIHKDIKPANALVDAAGNVRLTGFGIASRLPRERQAPAPPEIIAGTLAYMAPEQTGRMNRSIDARSDLYSLGVTFYEMLTGALPFTASDPMEWIHCHIARRPTPPSERVSGIPGPVEAIVLKLLAKTAEDRYQTAAGVEADLRRCLSAWEAHRRIDPFPLAAHDASDRLVIPEKLYGREAEIDALLAAFDRVVTERRDRARAGVGLCRHRQVLGRQRAAQGAGATAWPLCGRQVRPVQAGHPVCDAGPGLPEPRPSAPQQERGRAEPLANSHCWRRLARTASSWSISIPELALDHRRAAAGPRPSAARPAESVPAGVPAIPRRVRPAGAPARAVPR